MPPQLYIDSNIMIQQGRNLQSADLSLLQDLASARSIAIISTDLSQSELAKKFVANGMKELGDLGKPVARQLASTALDIELPKFEVGEIQQKLHAHFRKLIRQRFHELRIRTFSIDEVKPSLVFDDYHNQQGMFTTSAKKSQFPDAFIMHCLEQRLKPRQRLLVLTKDGDYSAYAQGKDNVQVVSSTDDLLKALGYQESTREVNEFLDDSRDRIMELAHDEIFSFGLEVGDVEDAEVDDFSVLDTSLSVSRVFDPIQSGDEVTIFGVADFELSVDFTHPDWSSAMRDSETKELYVFDSVSGDIETTLSVAVTIRADLDENSELNEVTELALDSRYGLYVDIDLYDFR